MYKMTIILPNILVKILITWGFCLFAFNIFCQDDNPFYILYNEGDHPRLNPASIYRLDHENCDIEHFIELNIYPHVPSLDNWTDIAICPEGTFYFIEAGGRVFEIDTITGELELYFTYDNPNNTYLLGLAIDYKGNFYALGQYEADIHIFYPETGEQYRSPPTASYEVGLDLTFYNNRIFFHNFWLLPKYFLSTNMLGTEIVDTLFSHNLPVNLGGMSTYADSCQSFYVLGVPNTIVTGIGYNHPVYEVHVEQDSIVPFCDRFMLPVPRRGMFGAAHRYENLASMPAVELQTSDYRLEYEDDCESSTARLTVTASGGISEIYFALNDNNFSRDSVFVLEEPGWYEIIAKDSRSCFWTDSFYFDPPPGLSFDGLIIGDEACAGAANGTIEVGAFSGFPSYVYSIDGGNPQSNGVFVGLTSGDYFIEVIDSMGCRIDTLVQIGISPEPDFVLMMEDEFCQSSNGRIEVSGSSLGDFEFSLNGSDFQDSPVFEGLTAGIYSVWARDSLDCLYSERADIARIEEVIFTHLADSSCVHEVPSLDSLWLTSAAGCDSVIVTQRVPADFTAIFLENFACSAQQAYTDSLWVQHSDDCDTLLVTTYFPAASDSLVIQRDSCSMQPLADEVYFYSNQYGCDSVVTIQYHQLMPSLFEIDSLVCHQKTADTLFLTNTLGCDSLVIVQYSVIDLWLDLGPDLYLQEGEEILLNPQFNAQIESFLWQPHQFLSDPTSLSPFTAPEQDIIYQLSITDIHGCTISDEISIFVDRPDLTVSVYIPNAFSPNGDGINDYFTVYFPEGLQLTHSIKVWDRWGALIYECRSENCQWNGTFRGDNSPEGTYVFEIQFIQDGTEETRRGEVVLVR